MHASSMHRVSRDVFKNQEGSREVRREASQPASKPVVQSVYERRGQTRIGSGGVVSGGGGSSNGCWTADAGVATGLAGGGGGSIAGGGTSSGRNGGTPVSETTGSVGHANVVNSGRDKAMGTTSTDSAFGAMAPCWRLLERAKAYMEQVRFPRRMGICFSLVVFDRGYTWYCAVPSGYVLLDAHRAILARLLVYDFAHISC